MGINGEVDVLLVANLRPITELEDLARRLKEERNLYKDAVDDKL